MVTDGDDEMVHACMYSMHAGVQATRACVRVASLCAQSSRATCPRLHVEVVDVGVRCDRYAIDLHELERPPVQAAVVAAGHLHAHIRP